MKAVFVALAVLVFAFVFMNDAVAQETDGATGGNGGDTKIGTPLEPVEPVKPVAPIAPGVPVGSDPICKPSITDPIEDTWEQENPTDPYNQSGEFQSFEDQSDEVPPPPPNPL